MCNSTKNFLRVVGHFFFAREILSAFRGGRRMFFFARKTTFGKFGDVPKWKEFKISLFESDGSGMT